MLLVLAQGMLVPICSISAPKTKGLGFMTGSMDRGTMQARLIVIAPFFYAPGPVAAPGMEPRSEIIVHPSPPTGPTYYMVVTVATTLDKPA